MDHGLVERLKKERAEIDEKIKEAEAIRHNIKHLTEMMNVIGNASETGSEVRFRLSRKFGALNANIVVENDNGWPGYQTEHLSNWLTEVFIQAESKFASLLEIEHQKLREMENGSTNPVSSSDG